MVLTQWFAGSRSASESSEKSKSLKIAVEDGGENSRREPGENSGEFENRLKKIVWKSFKNYSKIIRKSV